MSEVLKFNFLKKKYGKELLIDCRKFSETEKFTRTKDPFTVSFYEIYFITQGTGVFKLDTEEIPIQKGQVLLLPPNKVRQWTEINTKIDGYFIIFENEFIENFFRDPFFIQRFHFFNNDDNKPSNIFLSESDYLKTVTLLEEIITEIFSLKDDTHHMIRSLLYTLLIKLNRLYANIYNIKAELFQKNKILLFKKLLEANFKNKHSVEEYANMMQISRVHLNKTVKNSLGRTVSNIIKSRILYEAKRELLFSDKTTSEIAFELNFNDLSNFLRFFKKQSGISVKEFKDEFSK